MEKTNNQTAFDELAEKDFFKTDAALYSVLRGIRFADGSIGFDGETDGFLAIHRQHSLAALEQEIPACLILKKTGRMVILVRESNDEKRPDALIDGVAFEIKRISKAKNVPKAIYHQFRATHLKAKKLLLHIDQLANEAQVRGGIFIASKGYPTIETVWVIFKGQLFRFSKAEIKTNKHHFTSKK